MRITEETRDTLRELARASDESMQEVLAKAVELYRRHRILERSNTIYSQLREDPAVWTAEQEERRAWDVALADGLSPD